MNDDIGIWHYPDKGELPDMHRNIWVCYKDGRCLAHTNGLGDVSLVYAWCYLPAPPIIYEEKKDCADEA